MTEWSLPQLASTSPSSLKATLRTHSESALFKVRVQYPVATCYCSIKTVSDSMFVLPSSLLSSCFDFLVVAFFSVVKRITAYRCVITNYTTPYHSTPLQYNTTPHRNHTTPYLYHNNPPTIPHHTPTPQPHRITPKKGNQPRTSQNLMVWSLEQEISVSPVGGNHATHETLWSCPLNVLKQPALPAPPSEKSQILTVVSAPHDAKAWPSGLNETPCTTLVCPFSVLSHSPVS